MIYLYLDVSVRGISRQKYSPAELMHSPINKSDHSAPDPFCYFSLKLSFSTSPQTHYSTFAVSFFGSLSFASSFNWDVLLFIPLLSLEKNNHIYKYSQKFHLAPHIYLFRNREKILVDLWFHIDIRLQVGRYVVAKVPMVQKRQLGICNTIRHF